MAAKKPAQISSENNSVIADNIASEGSNRDTDKDCSLNSESEIFYNFLVTLPKLPY